MGIRQQIQNIHRLTGASIVYVTHDQSEALAMADRIRIVVMNKGRIEQVGTPQDIYQKPRTEFVARFVGKANLVRGEWSGPQFIPDNATGLHWDDTGVANNLKKKNLYPLRPEQIEFNLEGQGIPGIITSVQYQGKDIHYTVQVDQDTWTVHTDLLDTHYLGQQVYLQQKVGQRDKRLVSLS